MSSVLESIRRQVGVGEATHFDDEIIPLINAALLTLVQAGLVINPFIYIMDDTTLWETIVPSVELRDSVRMYVYFSVRLGFDPPSSTIIELIKQQMQELLWRINHNVEGGLV